MPTYEYQCPAGHSFELFQRMTDKPRAKCPRCGKLATRVISGGAGLIFKGSGFYITDYGKDGKGPRKPEAEPTSSDTTSAKTEGKTESKSGGETEAKPAGEKAEKPGGRKRPK